MAMMNSEEPLPEGSPQEPSSRSDGNDSWPEKAAESRQGSNSPPGENHARDLWWEDFDAGNEPSTSSAGGPSRALRKEALLHIDRQQIQPVVHGAQAEELRGLGVDVYDQEVLEQGVLKQMDDAISEANKAVRIAEAEKDYQSVLDDLRSCTASLKQIDAIIEQLTPHAATSKDVNRKLDSVKRQKYNKEQQLKKIRAKQRHLEAVLGKTTPDGTNQGGLEETEGPGPSSLGSMLIPAQEMEWEALIRTGQMTPFGTKIPQKEEKKPRRVMLTESSDFEKYLADQAKLSFERKRPSSRKRAKREASSATAPGPTPGHGGRGSGNKGKCLSKTDHCLRKLQKHVLHGQSKGRPLKAQKRQGADTPGESEESVEELSSPEDASLHVSDDTEDYQVNSPPRKTKNSSLKEFWKEPEEKEDFFSSSDEEEGDTVGKRTIKRCKDDGDENCYKRRLRVQLLPELTKMSAANKARQDTVRPFQEPWTELFGMVERGGKALCTVCNESVVCRTSSVKRHFETKHGEVARLRESERKEFFEEKLRAYHFQIRSLSQYLSSGTNHPTAASFKISLCIAKHGKPLSDGEMIKTAMLSGSDSLFHDFPDKDKIMRRISEMPLSRNTVKDRVQRMVADVSQQLTTDLQKAACYSMCVDESTDVTNNARLAVILRYAAGSDMKEELLKLASLPERTQGMDIYKAVMEVFSDHKLKPEKVVSITSDGAPSMVGAASGFIQLFKKEVGHDIIQFHCIIHQEALYAKDSNKPFEDVLRDVTKMVNYIMARALNARQFKVLLDEVQAQYNCLLMYNNVRWLSRGRVLERFVACLDEIRLFMAGKGQKYPQLTDMTWLTNLMFFTDFTTHLNTLNKQLQGVGKTAERMFSHIKAFERKLQIFERDLESGQLKYFPNLKTHLANSATFAGSEKSHEEIYKDFSSIVETAKVNFGNRFLQFREMETTLGFITSPDTVKFEELNLSCLEWLGLGNLEMELVDFQENVTWKNKFGHLREKLEKMETEESTFRSDNEILRVWNSLPNTFNSLKALGTALLTLFGSSYACEQLFSSLNFIKSDTRNRLSDELSTSCVALKLTSYEPRMDELSKGMQQQKSH